MAISESAQYNNGGVLPDIILLTLCYYHRVTRLKPMNRFCLCSLYSYLNILTYFSLSGGCSPGLNAALKFFFKLTLDVKWRTFFFSDDLLFILCTVL